MKSVLVRGEKDAQRHRNTPTGDPSDDRGRGGRDMATGQGMPGAPRNHERQEGASPEPAEGATWTPEPCLYLRCPASELREDEFQCF